MNKRVKISLYIFLLSVVLIACSTEKDAFLNRSYHGMTAHYNGYFNANELLRQSMETYRVSRPEDYYSLIPINPVPNETEVVGMYPAIDTAITKCKKVIQKHSMPSNDRPHLKKDEYNRWIDENWTTIGIASYYRHDFDGAMKSFKYVRKFYSNDPSLYVGELWMAKTNIATGKYTDAKFNLDNLDKAIKSEQALFWEWEGFTSIFKKKKKKDEEIAIFPKKIRSDLEMTKAELALIKGEKDEAIKYLIKAIDFSRDRKQKARLHFVLGQLYEEKGDENEAREHYTKVIKGNSVYEMSFNARIRRAFLGSGEKQRKELEKMLKDAKNAEYKDQVYYAMANLEFKEGNRSKGIEYLTLSAFYSNKNKRQKGMAYEKMGDLAFDDRDYVKAQKYYDSCATVIPEDYPNGEAIKNKAENLADLVVAVETAYYEDSVQRIASMDESSRKKFLKDLIKQIEEEAKRKRERDALRLLQLQENENLFAEDESGGKFYWNNAKSVREGREGYKRLWGERVDEDNWRRSEKDPVMSIGDGGGESIEDSLNIDLEKTDSLSVELLESRLPLSEEALAVSNERLLRAYYNAGRIYNEELSETERAKENFQLVLDKNVENPHNLLSAFELYKIYKGSDERLTNKNKDYILKNYPESDYAKFLLDPDYFITQAEKEAQAEKEYVVVLDYYGDRMYPKVISTANKVIDTEPENKYRSKYILLKALSMGQTRENKKELIPVLELALIEYPDSPEASRAKEMIDIINNGYSENIVYEANKNTLFKYDDRAKMKVIVVLDKELSSNQSKTRIANFNREFFSRERFTVSSAAYQNDQSLIILGDFETEMDASEYIRVYKSTRKMVKELQDCKLMMVSSENLKVIIQKQKLVEYEQFYEEYY